MDHAIHYISYYSYKSIMILLNFNWKIWILNGILWKGSQTIIKGEKGRKPITKCGRTISTRRYILGYNKHLQIL